MKLFKHQEQGIQTWLLNAGGFANFCEMGTGKTLMAINGAERLPVKRVLIVCPNTLKQNWMDEWEKWSKKNWNIFISKGTKPERLKSIKKASFSDMAILIVHYDMLWSLLDHIVAFRPELVIADESHFIKNHKAKRTKALKAIPCKYKLAMTGTPTPNNPLDIWSQFDWIRPGHLTKKFYIFRAMYADVTTFGGFPKIIRFKNLDMLKKLIDQYSFRRTKDECLDLPEKVFQTIRIDMDEKTRQAYKDMADEMVAEVEEVGQVSASTALVKLLRLQQITSGFIKVDDTAEEKEAGGDKIEALEELLESLSGEKIVIWARFNYDVERILNLANKMDIKNRFKLTGAVPQEDRQMYVNLFNMSEGTAVLVGNVAVGGVGLNLTSSRYCVYYSRTFSLGDALQSEDRLHRIGQKHKVTYYDLACKGTIDEYILKTLKKKTELSTHITGDMMKEIVYGV